MRNKKYDCLKGLAILLMVLGHAIAGESREAWCRHLYQWIYLFHMPVFFLLTGWFYRQPTDIEQFKIFTWRKVKRLWFPFVFWGIAFTLAHNTLVYFNITSTEGGFGPYPLTDGDVGYWSRNEILCRCLSIVSMKSGLCEFTGTFWFLRVMFWGVCGYAFVDFFSARFFRESEVRMVVLLGLFCGVAAIGIYQSEHLVSLLRWFGRVNTLTALLLIHVGVCLKRLSITQGGNKKNWAFAGIGAFLVLAELSPWMHVDLAGNQFPAVSLLILTSICGWVFLSSICDILVTNKMRIVGRVLAYLGRHTMPILIFHLLAFKLVSWLGICFYSLPSQYLGRFPVCFTGCCWVAAYLGAGVLVPLAANFTWERVRNRLANLYCFSENVKEGE